MQALNGTAPGHDQMTDRDQSLARNKAASLLREALALLGDDQSLMSGPSQARGVDRLLRLPEVQRQTGLRRSAIYEQMQSGTFPRSVKVGPRAASWSETAIQEWIAERLGGRKIGQRDGPERTPAAFTQQRASDGI